MKLIVGLGNPGKEFIGTRHNVGFMLIDFYLGNVIFKEKMNGLYYEKIINGEKIIFLKPVTYMNNSGISVKSYVDYYHIEKENILIIQDDLDLMLGKYKVKYISSSGGHNGIKSIINYLGTDHLPRLKIGIGHDKTLDTKDYVLSNFTNAEKQILNSVFSYGKDIIDSFIENGIDRVMNIYNKKWGKYEFY